MESIKETLLMYPILAPFLFVLLRALTVVVPPIPGIVIDLIGIAVFGWVYGLILGELGVLLGSVIAFLLARKFREPLVFRLAPLKVIEKWENKYSETQKFWTLVGIRLMTVPLFDYICYAAGLTKVRLSIFVFSTLLGTIPVMFLSYYLGEKAINNGLFFAIAFILGTIILSIVLKKIKPWEKRYD